MVKNGAGSPQLKGWLAMSAGLLAMTLGGVWTLQGLGYLGGGLMSGKSFWAVVGGVVFAAGLLLVVRGMRRRTAGHQDPG
ncbi:hypothetical protein [Actinoplanes couchii]|uniref:Integral membrane protein n=1 Tax=Actinoplanes couchii TaxID=403638 RepID=A0ABQ3X4E7_9ACTN|nr:hypothetical protein [Actinoplanes couchii]MDR6326266.1 hypothetical protein [Actinoplanes couchii]GID53382.1 hypothetical protein Aco03nite_017860 [Actinoplanes couchii]